ncbi:MAG: hypothetical protein JZU65_23750, partial [Chlorobium sp.]|nr:hypothetical protein [Chlorobium sp.]
MASAWGKAWGSSWGSSWGGTGLLHTTPVTVQFQSSWPKIITTAKYPHILTSSSWPTTDVYITNPII